MQSPPPATSGRARRPRPHCADGVRRVRASAHTHALSAPGCELPPPCRRAAPQRRAQRGSPPSVRHGCHPPLPGPLRPLCPARPPPRPKACAASAPHSTWTARAGLSDSAAPWPAAAPTARTPGTHAPWPPPCRLPTPPACMAPAWRATRHPPACIRACTPPSALASLSMCGGLGPWRPRPPRDAPIGGTACFRRRPQPAPCACAARPRRHLG